LSRYGWDRRKWDEILLAVESLTKRTRSSTVERKANDCKSEKKIQLGSPCCQNSTKVKTSEKVIVKTIEMCERDEKDESEVLT
jgi:hypothetical protein